MSKKVYTKEDIYEGMVLECVETEYHFWTVGKQYVVDKDLCIYNDDDNYRDITSILRYVNRDDSGTLSLRFKVVEHEEKHGIVQLFNYTFGIKTGNAETVTYGMGDKVISEYFRFDQKHITIPAYNTQQAIDYLTNELDYDINDIVSLEVN